MTNDKTHEAVYIYIYIVSFKRKKYKNIKNGKAKYFSKEY